MDDIEHELMILDMQEEIDDWKNKYDSEMNENPIWWNIRLGLIKSTDKEYEEAGKIMKEFVRLKALEGETVQERFLRFTQIKLNGQ